MKKRTCPGCYAEITPGPRERNPKKWCSERCRVRGYRIQNPDKVEEQKLRARATSCRIYVEPCDICGELKTWRSARRKVRTCSRSCENVVKAQRQRERYAANVESERERIYAWRRAKASPCVECGAPTTTNTAQRCGRCQRKVAAAGASEMHQRWRIVTSADSWRRNLADPLRPGPLLIEGPPRVADRPPRHFTAGCCAECREPFVVEAWSGRYCSPRCTPGWSQWISRSRRFDLYERDDWTCQICGDPVPLVTTYLHPLGASLDHVIPRSRGGSHADENLRMAHMLCNSLRGAPETGIAA